VLLAGGESSRMGELKALLPWVDGSPIIAYQVRALSEAGYAPIVVVLGHEADRVRAALPPEIEVTIVVNERYKEGRSSSIVAGVDALRGLRIGAVLIASVDQPRPAWMLRELRFARERQPAAVLTPSYRHRAGHPTLFEGSLVADLLRVTEEGQGLREVVKRHAGSRAFVDIDDPLVLTNLNTREDYEAALETAKRGA
jgi:molybdenum cofactor cytidylyltransferase